MKSIYIFIMFAVFALHSCIPGENPITAPPPGEETIAQVELGNNYDYISYFNFGVGKEVKRVLLRDWDLAFACSQNDFRILLNSGKFMSVYKAEEKEFESINTSIIARLKEDDWTYENPTGHIDSSAIGKWWSSLENSFISKGNVYVLNLGFEPSGRASGFAKLQVLEVDDLSYKIRFSDLRGRGDTTMIIFRDIDYNFVHLSIVDSGVIRKIEPKAAEWDICFSRFSELLPLEDGQAIWYNVVSALINQKYTVVSPDSTGNFESITRETVEGRIFSNRLNIIGHDWKWFDLSNSGEYFVNPNKIFIIKDRELFLYKMHFVDFYSPQGVKGSPKFAFQRL